MNDFKLITAQNILRSEEKLVRSSLKNRDRFGCSENRDYFYNIQNNFRMSHLIELEDLVKRQETQSLEKNSTQRSNTNKLKRLLSNFVHKFEKGDESYRLKISKTQSSFQAYMERSPICCDYSFLSKIMYKDSQHHIQYSSLLLKGRKPFTINTHSMRIASLIYLFELHKQLPYLTITINQNNGEIKMKNCSIVSQEIINRVEFFTSILHKMFMQTIENRDIFKKMLKYLSNDVVLNKKQKIPSIIDPTYKKVQLMLKYLKVCFIELNVSDRESQMQKNLKKRQLMQINRIHKSVPINIRQFEISKSMSLFQISEFPAELFERLEDIIISQQEIKQFNPYLLYPQAKIVNESQNQFIFNEILIKNPESLNVINSNMKGGTAQMSAAKVQFEYTINLKSSQKAAKKQIRRLPGMLQKCLLIKSPINKNTKQYIEHQMKILSTLKLSKSAYMIKYYKTDQNCAFVNLLMMDFLHNCPDLHTYIQRNKTTLSVLSKLVILSNIANGLRFLKNHHIVHMDLTPKNIMVGPNLITKIIDFGQAYCHMVKSNCNPGFTNPYGPPQVFTQKQFSTKQDVFSFGIIMFRLLFGNLPFEPTQKLKQSYRNKTYNTKLFFAIESLQYTWLQTPMLLLFSLFIRCKDTDQLSRPYPTWMRVILKMFLDWYKSIFLREDFYQRRSV